MSVARVWAVPGLGGMGGLRAEFAAGTETPHPSHRKKQARPAVHPNSKPCVEPEGRSTGEAILVHAERLGADLLVKGAYTQSRLRQMIFGGATRYLLDHVTLPMLMAH